MSSSGSLFFTGIVAILIIFQSVVLFNFWITHNNQNEIIENQKEIIEKLTLKANLDDNDRRYMEKLGLKDYEECLEIAGGSKEMCSRIERLLKMKWGDGIIP